MTRWMGKAVRTAALAGLAGRTECFSMGPRGACEIIDGGLRPDTALPAGGPGLLAGADSVQFPPVR